MIYRESRPSSLLTDIIERYWSVEYDVSDDAPIEPVLPDGCPEIVFDLADRFQRIPTSGDVETQASAIVSGQLTSRILLKPTGRVNIFGVRFRPYAAFGFLGVGMSSLTDEVIPLSEVIGSATLRIEDRINEASDFAERIAIVEQFIIERLAGSCGSAGIAGGIAEMISTSSGRMSMRELSKLAGVGERRIERMFAKHVGVSPKMYSRIVRFSGVVRSIEAAETFGLLDTALSFGYFDQSHMIHEFNEFAGTSPLAYFEATHRLSALLTS